MDKKDYRKMAVDLNAPALKIISGVLEKHVASALEGVHDAVKKDQKTLGRLLVLATKHCPQDHHDWREILDITNEN